MEYCKLIKLWLCCLVSLFILSMAEAFVVPSVPCSNHLMNRAYSRDLIPPKTNIDFSRIRPKGLNLHVAASAAVATTATTTTVAIAGAISGGLLGGALHAIAGNYSQIIYACSF
jgi:hypothetical protein